MKDHLKNKHTNRKKYRCKFPGCATVVARSDLLRRHSRIHDKPLFKCDFDGCYFMCRRSDGLAKHQRRHELKGSDANTEKPLSADGTFRKWERRSKSRESGVSEEKPFACDWTGCGKSFSLKRNMDYHVKLVHEKSTQKYPCSFAGCGKVCTSPVNLSYHMDIHSDKTFKCSWKNCQQVCKTRFALIEHKNIHLGKYKCDFEGCDHLAKSSSKLKTHQKSHSTYKCFKCQDCGKLWKNKEALKSHVLDLHPEQLPDIPFIVCGESGCDFKTKRTDRLKRHQIYRHSGDFECDVCHKRFAQQTLLQRHEDTHSKTNNQTYKCPDCDKELKDITSFRKHKDKWHKPKTIICEECAELFATKSLLYKHKKVKHTRYVCEWPGCDQSYASSERIKYHMNIHRGLKPYTCEWPGCDKAYADKNVLNVHVKRHKGEHVYRCQNRGCDFKCDYWTQLRRHEIQNHNC